MHVLESVPVLLALAGIIGLARCMIVHMTNRAKKSIKKKGIPQKDVDRLMHKMQEERMQAAKPLKGEDQIRFRAGNYRAKGRYADDGSFVVEDVKHRKEVYQP